MLKSDRNSYQFNNLLLRHFLFYSEFFQIFHFCASLLFLVQNLHFVNLKVQNLICYIFEIWTSILYRSTCPTYFQHSIPLLYRRWQETDIHFATCCILNLLKRIINRKNHSDCIVTYMYYTAAFLSFRVAKTSPLTVL